MLPAEGRKGAPPVWPLSEGFGAQAAREIALWQQLWAMPQAVQWERQRQVLEVALYVRRLVEVEQPDSSTSAGTLVRQMGDALGLTIPGMRSNRWRISTDEVTEKRDRPAAARPSARDRLTVVRDGTGA